MDPRTAVARHLRRALDAFGADLPLPGAGAPVRTVLEASRAGPAAAAATPVAPARPAPAREAPAPTADTPTLEQLAASVASCTKCKLHGLGRARTVFGEGAPDARVMFVGEAPGAREDELGRPFVGPAGQLLTKIIENAMGLPRSAVYIANVNKCRPPGNRNPEPDEVAACLPYLTAQVRRIRPEVIVALGRVAAHSLLGTTLPMRALRGSKLEYDGIPVVVTWHPAYLLREPSAKRDTWDDIKRVNRMLGLPEVPSRTAAEPASE